MSTPKNEQYHILSPEWLASNPLPNDAAFLTGNGKWVRSVFGGGNRPRVLIELIFGTCRTDLPPEAYFTPPVVVDACPVCRTMGPCQCKSRTTPPPAISEGKAGSDIPTPETDLNSVFIDNSTHRDRARRELTGRFVREDFARQLERQRDAAKEEFRKAAEWNQLTELELTNLRSLNADLSQDIDSIDMLRDEFRRIKACPGVTPEIVQLCDRALSDIKQRVPVIEQRDAALAQLEALRRDGERMKEALQRVRSGLCYPDEYFKVADEALKEGA